jgi:hypothetical protein
LLFDPAYVEIGDSVIYQDLNDEVVVLNMASHQYHGLNDIGASIWKMLLDEREVAAVSDRLVAEYDVEPETAQRELSALVGQLLDRGLLRPAQP